MFEDIIIFIEDRRGYLQRSLRVKNISPITKKKHLPNSTNKIYTFSKYIK